jgi:hypothetical protein
MLLFQKQAQHLPCGNSFSVHSLAANKISNCDLHRHGTRDPSRLWGRIASAPAFLVLARYIDLSIVQVTTNNLAVGIMTNVKEITDGLSDPGFLH